MSKFTEPIKKMKDKQFNLVQQLQTNCNIVKADTAVATSMYNVANKGNNIDLLSLAEKAKKDSEAKYKKIQSELAKEKNELKLITKSYNIVNTKGQTKK